MSPTGAINGTTVDTLQILAGLILVLGLIAILAWSLRRFHPMNMRTHLPAKIIGTLTLGARERITIIEIADQWLIIGITPGRMCMLATLQRQELPAQSQAATSGDFTSWLSRYMDKPHAH